MRDRFARTVDLLITNKKRRRECSEIVAVFLRYSGIDGHRLPSFAVELLHFCYTDFGGTLAWRFWYFPIQVALERQCPLLIRRALDASSFRHDSLQEEKPTGLDEVACLQPIKVHAARKA